MAASRRAVQSRTLASASTMISGGSGNDMECTALMMAQDSAAIQILLEAMHLYITGDHPSKEIITADGDCTMGDDVEKHSVVSPTKGMANQSITNICMFIHRIPKYPKC